MRWLSRLLRRNRLKVQLDSERRGHVERQAADYIAAGMREADARRHAAIEFGGLEQVNFTWCRPCPDRAVGGNRSSLRADGRLCRVAKPYRGARRQDALQIIPAYDKVPQRKLFPFSAYHAAGQLVVFFENDIGGPLRKISPGRLPSVPGLPLLVQQRREFQLPPLRTGVPERVEYQRADSEIDESPRISVPTLPQAVE